MAVALHHRDCHDYCESNAQTQTYQSAEKNVKCCALEIAHRGVFISPQPLIPMKRDDSPRDI